MACIYGGWKLLPFVVVGGVLVYGYNLELFGGRLHSDVWFALAWGAFPVLVGAYAQHWTLSLAAGVAAVAAFFLSLGQRALSTPARTLRRQVTRVAVRLTFTDGSEQRTRPRRTAVADRAGAALTSSARRAPSRWPWCWPGEHVPWRGPSGLSGRPARFDAVVVGAGPAGSVAALVLARGGARVALADKAAFPRDKACGDLIGPRGVQLLTDLGIRVPDAGHGSDLLAVGPSGRRSRLPAFTGRTYPGHGIVVPRRGLRSRPARGRARRRGGRGAGQDHRGGEGLSGDGAGGDRQRRAAPGRRT